MGMQVKMREFGKALHRSLVGEHNGKLALQYKTAARDLADESRLFRAELFSFRQHNKDPLQELIRIRQARQ